jgi:hypothetical protein
LGFELAGSNEILGRLERQEVSTEDHSFVPRLENVFDIKEIEF